MWRRRSPQLHLLGLAAIAAALALVVLMVGLICVAVPAQAAQAHAHTAAANLGAHVGSQPHIAASAQPTNGAYSQPTVGVSTPVAPATNPALGSSGLAIATILGCITGVLGLLIGSIALTALLRGGYGPFLRTLLPGAKRRAVRARAEGRSGSMRGRPAGAYSGRGGRDFDASPPRRTGAPSSRAAGPRRR